MRLFYHYSTYGNLIAEFIPDRGSPFQIGAIKGVAVYTTINTRYVSLKLNASSKDLKNGKIRLRYTSRKDAKKQEMTINSV